MSEKALEIDVKNLPDLPIVILDGTWASKHIEEIAMLLDKPLLKCKNKSGNEVLAVVSDGVVYEYWR